MPATYAATVAALTALREQRPGWCPRTMLDLGAGLGAGMWAATAVWPELDRITAVEALAPMIAVGQDFVRVAKHPGLRTVEWLQADLLATGLTERYDLVLIGYVLAELPPSRVAEVVDRAWGATDGALTAIEPGTPDGYGRVLRAQDLLLASGGFPLAPCPHLPPCRMPEGDWCHFSVRLPRSQIHRAAKGATMGYEDEKFSYVAVTRAPAERSYSRILRHPQIRGGHVYLQICAPGGPKTIVVSKRDRELFHRARKSSWGDTFDVPADALG
jgi:ribosomal protein RSM22 (predicted rRNA methylase)